MVEASNTDADERLTLTKANAAVMIARNVKARSLVALDGRF
jgi:hypothetical protein